MPTEAEIAMLSEDTVTSAFRLILGREPESPEVLAYHCSLGTEAALRDALLGSAEFADAQARRTSRKADRSSAGPVSRAETTDPDERPETDGLLLARGILPPMGEIGTRADPETEAALWQRVARSWEGLGTEAPHWSVITHDAFRPETLEANRASFVGSAEAEGALVDAAFERLGGADPSEMRCLEIGCGVGRATRALATRFAHVKAVDISSTHLSVAERELADAGFANVTVARVQTLEDYRLHAADRDFIFSRLVLQHNPPPLQRQILAAAFDGLVPGGTALVQIVTYARDYGYDPTEDVQSDRPGMEMHVLPQPEMFRLIAAAGLETLEVQEDFAAGRDGRFRSHLFLTRRPSAS